MSNQSGIARKFDITRLLSIGFVIVTGLVSAVSVPMIGIVGAMLVTVAMGAILASFIFALAPAVVRSTIPAVESGEKKAHKDAIPPDRLDPLTGLANENGLMAWLSEKGGRIAADGKGIIIVAADLEDFDKIERTHGREVAEAVLIEVARRVATCTGSEGIAARTSGDEFAAIATVVPQNYAEFAAEQAGKLAELIQRPVELPSGVVWIGGSVGAAAGPVEDGDNILANAREALKKAKRLGRGHYVVHKTMSA